MKKKSILILSTVIVVLAAISIYIYMDSTSKSEDRENACLEKLKMKLESGLPADLIFQEDFQKLQYLVENSLVARSLMLKVTNRLEGQPDAPISSKDLLILKAGTEDYLDLREDLYKIVYGYECAINIDASILEEYNVDADLRLKGIMLSIGAALTLFDNYMLGSVMFQQDKRLRRVINDPDMGFGLVANKLEEMTLAASSIENRYRVRRAIKFYEENSKKLESMHEDSDFAYLQTLIESSPSYNYIKKIRVKEVATTKFAAFERISSDMIEEMTKNGVNAVSELFGNAAGLYEKRKGKLYGNAEVKERLMSVLQPLDILLEKTPFRLTDKLIPGHFGHVAIWTGTKAELIDIGIWRDMHVLGHHEDLSSSSDEDSKDERQIIEAIRSGVQLSTLDEFINIDDIAILRPIFDEESKNDLTQEALIMAFRQLGKKYDFNFDVNTTDKIVCSELAYISFPSIDWPTEATLGRHSISPDNVAKLAWNNLPLELIMFYHDGQLVDEDIQVEKMKELMTK